jgi:hypothetical protein
MVYARQHVAVTYSNATQRAAIYVSGKQVSISPSTITPAQVKITQAWLGRSQHPWDPYLNARVEDFRFYSGALR